MSLEIDEKILCRRSGYRETLAKLIDEYQPALYALCLRLVGHHEDAADLVQHTFLQAVKNVAGFQGYASLRTWLYAIAVNACRNFLRRKAFQLRALSALVADQECCEQHPVEVDEIRRHVQKSLMDLPEKQRMAVILRVYEEISYREIAEILGCRESTARSHVHWGLKHLAPKLQQFHE